MGLLLAAGFGLQLLRAAPGAACDVALLLTVDVSGSIDRGEYRLQVEGMAAALDDPEVAEALLLGQAAQGVVQWSGAGKQAVSMPWRRMLSPAEVADFARRARELPRAYTGSDTAVGEAIAFAVDQFAAVPDCRRKVIDISGDGPNNQGGLVTLARDEVLAEGITINGLPLMTHDARGASWRLDDLDIYYARCVIGGPGAFVIPVTDWRDFTEAVTRKLVLEIAGIRPERVIRVESPPPYDCEIGEKIWRRNRGLHDLR